MQIPVSAYVIISTCLKVPTLHPRQYKPFPARICTTLMYKERACLQVRLKPVSSLQQADALLSGELGEGAVKLAVGEE